MFTLHIVRCTGKKTTITRVSTSLYVQSNCDRLFAAVELVFGVVHPGYSECLSWTGTYTKRAKKGNKISITYQVQKHVSFILIFNMLACVTYRCEVGICEKEQGARWRDGDTRVSLARSVLSCTHYSQAPAPRSFLRPY